MKTFSKFTIPHWAGLFFVLFLAVAGLRELPLGAQDEPGAPSTDSAKPAETSGASEQKTAEPSKPMPPAPAAKKLFEDARQKLASRMYKAKIVQRIHFPDRSLDAVGSIVRGDKYRVRIEFEVKSGPTVGKLLQVSNGDKLWTERRVNEKPRLTVQDIKEIVTKAGKDRENLVVAEMGLGGITSLLASMDRTINFGKPETVEIDGEQLLKVDGEWNREFMERMKANPLLGKGLPEYIPDGIRVYFDRDDFPRRIQYLKKEQGGDVLRPIVTMDFLDVEWLSEADVNPSMFEYEPPDKVYPEDVTKTYLDLLKPPTSPAPPVPVP